LAAGRPGDAQAQEGRGAGAPDIRLTETPDVLARLSQAGNLRPRLVVGFALETEDLAKNATVKLRAKGCDWIIANAVSDTEQVFGSDQNTVALVTSGGMEVWPRLSKLEVGRRIAAAAADYLAADRDDALLAGVS